MKIQIMSDLHQEFGFVEQSFEGADVVIFAGDVNLGVKGIEWIKSVIADIPVIYVLGNHEYYRGSYPKTLRQIQEAGDGTNVYVLENKSVMLGDVTFYGASLWTDFALHGDSRTIGALCEQRMNDYRQIRKDPSYSRLRSIDTFLLHQESLRWLQRNLQESTTAKNIVVTHHAPSARSLPDYFKHDVISSAYASNLEPVIMKYQPLYWIHGHIHKPVRYSVGSTVVLSNPHGYINEPCNGFNKNLLIEV